jgi:hypothetical protein
MAIAQVGDETWDEVKSRSRVIPQVSILNHAGFLSVEYLQRARNLVISWG